MEWALGFWLKSNFIDANLLKKLRQSKKSSIENSLLQRSHSVSDWMKPKKNWIRRVQFGTVYVYMYDAFFNSLTCTSDKYDGLLWKNYGIAESCTIGQFIHRNRDLFVRETVWWRKKWKENEKNCFTSFDILDSISLMSSNMPKAFFDLWLFIGSYSFVLHKVCHL